MDDHGALAEHPELAQLWTLHFAGRMALRLLESNSPPGPQLLARPAVTELQRAIEELLRAIERYKHVVLIRPSEELRVHIPESWTAEQADAVLAMLGEVADRVWRAQGDRVATPPSR